MSIVLPPLLVLEPPPPALLLLLLLLLPQAANASAAPDSRHAAITYLPRDVMAVMTLPRKRMLLLLVRCPVLVSGDRAI
jgi:hypothetical protein